MPTTALPRCHIVNPSHTCNEDGSITGEYTPDSGDLALHTVDFADPMWRSLPSTSLDRKTKRLYDTPTRTLVLRMRALIMVANDNQNLHSLVRLRAQLANG